MERLRERQAGAQERKKQALETEKAEINREYGVYMANCFATSRAPDPSWRPFCLCSGATSRATSRASSVDSAAFEPVWNAAETEAYNAEWYRQMAVRPYVSREDAAEASEKAVLAV